LLRFVLSSVDLFCLVSHKQISCLFRFALKFRPSLTDLNTKSDLFKQLQTQDIFQNGCSQNNLFVYLNAQICCQIQTQMDVVQIQTNPFSIKTHITGYFNSGMLRMEE